MHLIKVEKGRQIERTYCNGREHEVHINDKKVRTEPCECFRASFTTPLKEPFKDPRQRDGGFHYMENEPLD